jgi:hypothetical protein
MDRWCISSGAFLDALDYWLTQARLWIVDGVYGVFRDDDTPG